MNLEEKDLKNELEEHEVAPDAVAANGTVDLETYSNDDEEFGGYENRKKLERKLLWKTDARFAIMIISAFMLSSHMT